MSSPDSLTYVLLEMSNIQLGILFLKMASLLLGVIISLGGVAAAAVKLCQWVWRTALGSMKADLAASFCTPAQLTQAMAVVTERLDDGDARMKRIEDDARETRDDVKRTRESVEQLNRRFLRILSLLITHGSAVAANPSLQAAMDSDSDLPTFDLPHGDSSCTA